MIKLSARLQKMLGTEPQGPNCWNATQMFHKPRTHQRFTPIYEMERWIGTHTREIKGPPQEGDILVLWTKHGELVHTAVKLGLGKWFHKAGWKGEYAIDPIHVIDAIYKEDWDGRVREYRRFRK